MARRRRKARVVKPVVEEQEILEEELVEELEEELVEEEVVVEPKPKPRRRRKKVVASEPVEDLYDDDDDDDEEEAKPAPRSRRKKKVVEPEPESEETFSSADLFEAILDGLSEGQSVVITAGEDDEWVLSAGGEVVAAPTVTKLRGRAYYDEVQSPEFKEHKLEWKELTFAEKKSHAKKIKAVWEPHEDSRVEVMRITTAVRKKLGIEKYKPEYRNRAARAAIRE